MGKASKKHRGEHQESMTHCPLFSEEGWIRPMVSLDLKQVMDIEKKSHSKPWSNSSFLNEMKPNAFRNAYVLQSAQLSKILGYACFWILEYELSLLNLTIHPDHQKQGLGTRFLKWILATGFLQGATQAILEVRGSNGSAVRLYKKAGFFQLDKRKNYYQSPEEDALILCHSTLDTLTI